MPAARPIRALLLILPISACGGPEVAEPLGYCYRTLADVVCYSAPDPGREGRLTGVLHPPSEHE